MRSILTGIALSLLLMPAIATAWWSDEWEFRKEIIFDTTTSGGNITTTVTDVPVLIRLDLTNFGYFLDTLPDGGDIRFVAGDDVTPLKYHIERYDPELSMAFIWVKVPRLTAATNADTIYMYYGNPDAVAGDDVNGTYDVNQVLVYHFDEAASQDATAYGNQPGLSSAQPNPASLIAAGVLFDGGGSITIPSSPSLRLLPDQGMTFSTWVNLSAAQADGYVMEFSDPSGASFVLAVDGTAPYLRYTAADGATVETSRADAPTLTPGEWVHLSMRVGEGRMAILVDGVEAVSTQVALAELGGSVTLGASGAGSNFLTAQLDEVQFSNIARSADWLKAAAVSQGFNASAMLRYGADAQRDTGGHPNYFLITLQNVSNDGWVVIGILIVMFTMTMLVMAGKAFVIARVRKDNQAFLADYNKATDIESIDRDETDEEHELSGNPLLEAMVGKHDHYQSSTLYHIYHAGVQQVRKRLEGQAVGARPSNVLTPEAIASIRSALRSSLVRETQRLNSQMVLLTLAIAGGPFLGLLGTVVGVMITFAAIAASGDVNVNAIAPGVAAALSTTVAGLAVAIPALFGYNYLGTRIKEITADMRVFVEELVTRLAEAHS